VALDAAGGLVNRGIAASGGLLETLRTLVNLESFRDSDVEGYRWYDGELGFWLHLGYLGEVHFRGLEAPVSVYGLVPVGTTAA
jgi:hypothetical protein